MELYSLSPPHSFSGQLCLSKPHWTSRANQEREREKRPPTLSGSRMLGIIGKSFFPVWIVKPGCPPEARGAPPCGTAEVHGILERCVGWMAPCDEEPQSRRLNKPKPDTGRTEGQPRSRVKSSATFRLGDSHAKQGEGPGTTEFMRTPFSFRNHKQHREAS